MILSDSNEPADLPPVNPYAPPKAELARTGGTMRQILRALLKVAAVGASGFIAFCATCAATIILSNPTLVGNGAVDLTPYLLFSFAAGVAVMAGMVYTIFFRQPRSRKKE
jgi:hypothetical protein